MSQFCLRWNNHQPNFISVFTNLLNTESLVDVTLAAEGKHLQAHKVVLSACSVYFQTLFTTNPSRHPIVIIKDVAYADLRVLVDFMYYGEVHVTEEQLPRILDTARLLNIKGLTEMPDSTKHGSSPANTETASPERRPNNKDDSAQEWESTQSPDARSPSSKWKRRKTTDDIQLDMDKETNTNIVQNMEQNPVQQTSVQPNNMYRESELYAQVQRSQQEAEENAMKAQQLAFQSHMGQNANFVQQDQNNQIGRLIAPISGMWVNAPYVNATSTDTFPERPDAGSDPPVFSMLAEQQNTPANNGTVNPYHIYSHTRLQGSSDTPQRAEPATKPQRSEPATKPQRVEPTKPRRRTANPQAAENFQRAIEAVRFGGIGFCKAARIFGVNNRTLWLEYKKKGYPIHRPSIRERIKREPVEPEAPAEPPVADVEQPQPAPFMLGQTCFQYLQDSSLPGF